MLAIHLNVLYRHQYLETLFDTRNSTHSALLLVSHKAFQVATTSTIQKILWLTARDEELGGIRAMGSLTRY